MNLGSQLSQIVPVPGVDSPSLDAVLVAEDDPLFLQTLTTWLKQWQYRVTAVTNGNDAWSILQQPHAPQMAILDWMMPGTDGIELCRRIRSHPDGLYRYVLLATARDEQQDVAEGLEAGADDYLTKPFSMNELRARVRAGERILQLQDAMRRAQNAMQFEAAHDPLTRVWNRAAILDFLVREAQRHQRMNHSLAVMLLDIDHLKALNETYGCVAGDAVLQGVADRVAASVRKYDLLGRYLGEEFLIVLPECSPQGLMHAAERLRLNVESSPVKTLAGPIPVSITIGVAAGAPSKNPPLDHWTLLSAADESLRLAKSKGGNRIEATFSFPSAERRDGKDAQSRSAVSGL